MGVESFNTPIRGDVFEAVAELFEDEKMSVAAVESEDV